jgi:hypothetical protein
MPSRKETSGIKPSALCDADLCVKLREADVNIFLAEALGRLLERQSEERYDLVDRCVHRIVSGRAAVNFGRIPEVARALEWAAMDVRTVAALAPLPGRVKRLVAAAREVVRASEVPSDEGTLARLSKAIPKLSSALEHFQGAGALELFEQLASIGAPKPHNTETHRPPPGGNLEQ